MNFPKFLKNAEIKYILYAGLFAFAWFLVIYPLFLHKIEQASYLTQFLFFNIGLYIFFFIFLRSVILSEKSRLGTITGLAFLYSALDTWGPEYHVSINGTITKGAALGASASDYVWGMLANNLGFNFSINFPDLLIQLINLILKIPSSLFNVSLIMPADFAISSVFIFTYLVMPTILLYLASKLLPNFVKNL